jgi:glycosyltransferase involved in cell wall biosynthesis
MGGVERWAMNVQKSLQLLGCKSDLYVVGHITVNPRDFGQNVNLRKIDSLAIFKFFLLNEYSIVISALTKINLYCAIFSLVSKAKVISSVHVTLTQQPFESKLKYNLRKIAHLLILALSHRTICPSEGVACELRKIFPWRSSVLAIPNPCFSKSDIVRRQLSLNPRRHITLAAAGRLAYQKGFDILIEAYCGLPEGLKSHCYLSIYGDGDETYKKYLLSLIRANDAGRIRFPGISDQLFLDLIESDIFILSSRYEGFGNVLAEALAADCFCVSFNIPHGPAEILDNGKYGTLLKSVSAEILSEKLADIINKELYLNRSYTDGERIEHLMKYTPDHFAEKIGSLLSELSFR